VPGADTRSHDLKVAILVPRRAGRRDRDRIWEFCRKWWAREHDWPIVVGDHTDGPFNRSAALNRAAEAVGAWDAAVLIDADVLINPVQVRAAVDLAFTTGGPVLAYDENMRVSLRGTQQILSGNRGDWRKQKFVANVATEFCSSALAVRRDLWDAVGGFDESFVGWGYEDTAFRYACETMSGKEMVRLPGVLWHLWHAPSPEADRRALTFQANRARCALYRAARFDRKAMAALLAQPQTRLVVEGLAPTFLPTRIPRILHRTVPEKIDATVEKFWKQAQRLHPGWEFRTYRDPIDPRDWPLSSQVWDRCTSGAQLAGLIRLEALVTYGGVYIDSDVELYRSLEPLLGCQAFAGWEDANVVPDAVLGAVPGHVAIDGCLVAAVNAVARGEGAWETGPGITTHFLRGRDDVLLLPPGSFYPWHYHDKAGDHRGVKEAQPWAFGAHHWAASWVAPIEKAIAR
jgi:hypothetical protein